MDDPSLRSPHPRFRDAFVLRAFHDLGDPDKTIPIQLFEQTVNLRLIVAAAPTP
jgi:hypothetical protein